MPQLFHYPWAPYARKALLGAYEVDAVFEEVVTPAFDKAVMDALRARTSPLVTMPCLLLDDGRFISESSLIIEHFDLESSQRGALVPLDPRAALEVRGYDRLADNLLGPTHYLTWALRKPPAEMNHKRIAETRAKMTTVFQVVDQRLAGRQFMYDERFTMADMGLASAVSVLLDDRSIALSDLDVHPNVRAWYDRVTERASWRQLMECVARVPRPPQLA